MSIHGKPDFKLKQKIKMLRQALRNSCNSSAVGIKAKVRSLRKEKEKWDTIIESKDLSDSDALNRDTCIHNLILAEKENSTMLQQRARNNWAFEGDENSGFYHAAIKYRQRKNSIRGFNGIWSESPIEVKAEVAAHFERLFKAPFPVRPKLVSAKFQQIQPSLAATLVAPFFMDELKTTVWSCGSDEVPGSDGLNFKLPSRTLGNIQSRFLSVHQAL